MSYDLALLGWTALRAAELPDGTVPGRVSRVDRGAAEVLAADGRHHVRYAAHVRRASAADPVALPCVGDWVALSWLPEGRYELDEVLPRTTAFVRGGVSRDSVGGLSGDGQGQVLAANVDVVFVAEPSMHSTDFADLGRIERLVALAWESGGTPVVLITKSDLFESGLADLLADVRLAAPGVAVHAVSSQRGEGVSVVREHLEGSRTAVILGPSGAGKSTLVNALAGGEVMETQQVRAADGRGRHTTVHRELIPLPGGGLLIDTPGIRRIGLYDMGEGVDLVFSDIESLAEQCRFGDCGHTGEPGCAVLAALERGELPERRLQSWRKLQREAVWIASRTDARLRKEQQNKWKIIHKEMRRSGRARP
ncbi:Probable GTPase related to EngC [[Actinomadura] parvosata subsp. kistnae]|uniref:Small ribosomal subunit biogenesis GTPase RsgA n=1 Tax=[Actinomadura] parvosata subsp. kistnae TaxID=1909395 RepID=A0A1U9ZQW3_9ACTN|nr:ribosome small subunit-dependent GTPase A [Nonomuraea sp. ATCC 55076]AQZ60343.1 ribosome small subunit-dependent GTPase A [Nonomuraea sp. ATCC 55076]SPL91147.1 Probable GTPase related to EngC [Actinomadura parvosata subsp. kistnae]